MSLDEQLADLLNSLGVTLEGATDTNDAQPRRAHDGGGHGRRATHDMAHSRERSQRQGQGQGQGREHGRAEMAGRDEQAEPSEQAEQAEQATNPLEETMSAYQHPGDWEDDETDDMMAPAELSLFQTSREHYGVFYRLDLVGGAPHLRVFAPDEEGALKMRCYLVRASSGAPLRDWFGSTRAHNGSDAFGASRDTIEQHLLFAAGEALKRLFWSGEPERMRFPWEIEVERVA